MSTNKHFDSVINFTHGDLDGLGCQILTRLAFQECDLEKDLSIIRCTDSGKSVDDAIKENLDWIDAHENTLIIITDVVPTREYLETLVGLFPGRVRVIDHHKSNLWVNEILPGSVFPGEPNGPLPSGTSLYYKYLLENEDTVVDEDGDPIKPFWRSGWISGRPARPYVNLVMLEDFVNIVRSWDIFEWAKTGYQSPKMMQTLFVLLGADEFACTMVRKINKINGEDMFDKHELKFIRASIASEKAKMDAITVDKVKIVTINGYNCAVMFFGGGMNFSDMATRFLNKYPLFDVFIGIMPGAGVLSYRTTRDDIDVAELFAKPLGGGGHPKAAGSPINVELMEDVMNLLLPGEDNIWLGGYAVLEAKNKE